MGALLVALTQARGHCHSGRYYSGLELGTRSDNTTSCFFANTGIGRVQPAAVQVQEQVQGEAARAPAPGPHLTVSAAGGQWRHVTLSRAPHHSCGCHVSRVTMSRCPAAAVVTGLVPGAGCVHRVDAGARDGKVMQSVSWDHTTAQPPPPPPATTCFTRASTALNHQYVTSHHCIELLLLATPTFCKSSRYSRYPNLKYWEFGLQLLCYQLYKQLSGLAETAASLLLTLSRRFHSGATILVFACGGWWLVQGWPQDVLCWGLATCHHRSTDGPGPAVS